MIFLRKLVFYVFLGLYGIVCPLLILRMVGFVFQPGVGLVKTGLVYVSTNPPGATLLIDGIAAHEKTPTVVRDLLPGEHDIIIDLAGYNPWKKTLSVAGKKATALENILLIPKVWKTKDLTETEFGQIWPLNGNLSLIASRGNNVEDVFFVQLNKDTEERSSGEALPHPQALFPPQSIYKGAKAAGYFTVDKSPFFVLHITDAKKNKYLWVDPREKPPRIEDITELLIGQPQQLAWDVSDDKNIFALENGVVNHLNIKSRAIYPGILEGVRALGVMDNGVFGLTQDGVLVRCDYDGQNKKETVLEPRELMLLASHDHGLLAYIVNGMGITYDVLGMALDHDRSLAMIWTKNRIGVLDYSREAFLEHLPSRVVWIYSRGHNITQAFWANNANNIIIRDGNRIILLDKTNFGQNRMVPIVSIEPNTAVYFTEKIGKLYYLAPGTRYLSWIQIVHNKPLLSVPIAETLRL